ncbi:MAG TPA: hypothetical protein VIU61_04325 [Kofleriaceae bacterium]
MKKSTSKTLDKKLGLARDTLRVLSPGDLVTVGGGWTMSGVPWCRETQSVGSDCGTGSFGRV